MISRSDTLSVAMQGKFFRRSLAASDIWQARHMSLVSA